jgi:hypothetical protein
MNNFYKNDIQLKKGTLGNILAPKRIPKRVHPREKGWET